MFFLFVSKKNSHASHQTYTSFLSSVSKFFFVSVDGADDVIGWLRFGKLGESLFEFNENCRANRDIRFVSELFRVLARVSMPFGENSASPSLSWISVIIGPVELNGCVCKFGIGGVDGSCGVVCKTRTTEKFAAVPSAGRIRASDGLLWRAVAKNQDNGSLNVRQMAKMK